jgi:putative membrane protein
MNKVACLMVSLAAPPYDLLDSMMWSIVATAFLLGVAGLRLPIKATGLVDEHGKNVRVGLAIALGATGLYLFITGLLINVRWPFTPLGGVYNVLFGGSASLAGLVLLSASVALFLNVGLKEVSYFAVVLGVYLVVDAVSIIRYGLTSTPPFSTAMYLAAAVVAFLSIPFTHTSNKWIRWLFTVAAFLFALFWLYEAANTTLGHLAPPLPK